MEKGSTKPRECVHAGAYEVREGQCGMPVGMSKKDLSTRATAAIARASRVTRDAFRAQPTALDHGIKWHVNLEGWG